MSDEMHLHPLTGAEYVEVMHAIGALIAVLPPGDDERGRVLALLESAQEKLGRHWCEWCPVEVRDLSAVAHNAAVNYGTNREIKKMAELKHSIQHYQPAVDEHFAAVKTAAPSRTDVPATAASTTGAVHGDSQDLVPPSAGVTSA